jgi:hypothetical protein
MKIWCDPRAFYLASVLGAMPVKGMGGKVRATIASLRATVRYQGESSPEGRER